MPIYNVAPQDGDQVIRTNNSGDLYHDLSIRVSGATPAGTVTLTGRKPGSDVFEEIPDGVFDLSNLNSIQFTGGVFEYNVNISGLSGVSFMQITDTTVKGC